MFFVICFHELVKVGISYYYRFPIHYHKTLRQFFHDQFTIDATLQISLYINILFLSGCLFVSNKLQNGWTDRVQIFWGSPPDPREGLWIQNLPLTKFDFWKIWKTRAILFYSVCKLVKVQKQQNKVCKTLIIREHFRGNEPKNYCLQTIVFCSSCWHSWGVW